MINPNEFSKLQKKVKNLSQRLNSINQNGLGLTEVEIEKYFNKTGTSQAIENLTKRVENCETLLRNVLINIVTLQSSLSFYGYGFDLLDNEEKSGAPEDTYNHLLEAGKQSYKHNMMDDNYDPDIETDFNKQKTDNQKNQNFYPNYNQAYGYPQYNRDIKPAKTYIQYTHFTNEEESTVEEKII